MSDNSSKTYLRVGLTGGIASGKSTVADLFAALEVPIIDTDVIAREVVSPGSPALSEIERRFGSEVISADGHLRRRALRRLIFDDSRARSDLEDLLHPAIGAETVRQAQRAGGAYQVIVVPLLVGSDLLSFVNRVLVVDCEEETQLRRLLRRDTETLEQARRILASQASREARLAIADDVVRNDASLQETERQVLALHQKYLAICESNGGGAE